MCLDHSSSRNLATYYVAVAPPLICDKDELTRRLVYGWYIGSFPRKDLILNRGADKSLLQADCDQLKFIAALPTLIETFRNEATAIILHLNGATGQPLTTLHTLHVEQKPQNYNQRSTFKLILACNGNVSSYVANLCGSAEDGVCY